MSNISISKMRENAHNAARRIARDGMKEDGNVLANWERILLQPVELLEAMLRTRLLPWLSDYVKDMKCRNGSDSVAVHLDPTSISCAVISTADALIERMPVYWLLDIAGFHNPEGSTFWVPFFHTKNEQWQRECDRTKERACACHSPRD